jgi:hypothetical protein
MAVGGGEQLCDVRSCGRPARYRFAAPGRDLTVRCRRHGLAYPSVLRRALTVAGIVGTVLFAINQLDVVVAGQVTPLVVAKIALTYLVPFSVSAYSSLAASRIPAPALAGSARGPAAGDGASPGAGGAA